MRLYPVRIRDLVAAAILLLGFSSCGRDEPDRAPDGAELFDVAIYQDVGCWSTSVTALERMFEWMGYRVTRVDADRVNRAGLQGCALFCVPGGDMYQYSHSLSSEGKDKIREFIRAGGGYIGICGGAYFAADRVFWQGRRLDMDPLGLYQGSSVGPVDEIVPYPDSGMCRIQMVDRTHPITAALPDSAWVLYYWGPELLPDSLSSVTVLGKYSAVDEPAILAFGYGLGRVFLIGVHPEIEEDDDRDGVDCAEGFDDWGSDWDLMKQATLWCLNR